MSHGLRACEFRIPLQSTKAVWGAVAVRAAASLDILEFRGMARVVVDGRYTYETDLDLVVGDEVLLPPSGLGGQWVARVTELSSDYAGPCRRILGLVRRRADAERQDAALAAVPITGLRTGTTFEVTASCGHRVLLHIEGVNRTGRPTHVRYTCQACGGIPHTAGLGSADAWRRMAAGLY